MKGFRPKIKYYKAVLTSSQRFPEEFKIKAAKQITENRYNTSW
jgi:transposase-like protein